MMNDGTIGVYPYRWRHQYPPMATGLLALLDDVSALVKATAASLDDLPAQVAKTSSKVSGIVIDDTAVTPKYVVGLSPARELAIIVNIAKKSLRNKLLFLGPLALLLGNVAPWAMGPLLMVGGGYLCFEGYEKAHGWFSPHSPHDEHHDGHATQETITPEALEAYRVESAVRTDFILSAEIIAIAYATVAEQTLLNQAIIVLLVSVLITAGVYGFVGLLVKLDDIGLYIAQTARISFVQAMGRGLVKAMPFVLAGLGYVGTLAMLWVGAEIILHGVEPLHHSLEAVDASLKPWGIFGWGVKIGASALIGLCFGFLIERAVVGIQALRRPRT
jgi:uncharacterized protein